VNFTFFSFCTGGDFVDDGDLQIEFLLEADERDHDSGLALKPCLGRIGGGFEHGARLHAGDLGILDAEAAAAETEHRVELVQLVHAVDDFLDGDVELSARDPSAIPSCSAGIRAAADRGNGSWPGSLSAP
jgi:hypothetical protein